MRKNIQPSKRSIWLTAICASAIGLLTLEAFSRFLPKNYYEWQHRYMFVSEGVHINKTFADGSQTRWYKPNSAINWAVFYGYPWQYPSQEYSIWSTTNNIGLVQSADAKVGVESIAIFGDSFTEPQATTPWFYSLENHWKRLNPKGDIQLLNFGYQGSGIGRWDQITNNLSEIYGFNKVIYVAISQDFARFGGAWNKNDLSCLNDANQCHKGQHYQSIKGNQQSREALRQRAKKIMTERHSSFNKRLRYGICGVSELARQTSRVIFGNPCSNNGPPTRYEASITPAVSAGLHVFRQHIAKYGASNVYLVWIPERHEAATGRISEVSKRLLRVAGKDLPKNHIVRCPLKASNFYKKDGHQNEAGSRIIYQCVAQVLTRASQSLNQKIE